MSLSSKQQWVRVSAAFGHQLKEHLIQEKTALWGNEWNRLAPLNALLTIGWGVKKFNSSGNHNIHTHKHTHLNWVVLPFHGILQMWCWRWRRWWSAWSWRSFPIKGHFPLWVAQILKRPWPLHDTFAARALWFFLFLRVGVVMQRVLCPGRKWGRGTRRKRGGHPLLLPLPGGNTNTGQPPYICSCSTAKHLL